MTVQPQAAERTCCRCGDDLPDGSDPRVPSRLVVCKRCGWEANPGPQTKFLRSRAYEVFYGGAAGGGKTEGLVMRPLRYIHVPTFRALIVRRTFPELRRDILPLMHEHYPKAGGRAHVSDNTFRFDSGAVIEYGHVERESDVHKYQGLEVQDLELDELTSFTRYIYTYLSSRVRSTNGVPPRIGSASNPGGEGHEWVMKRWAPWLDRRESYKGPRAAPGQTLYYRPEEGDGDGDYCARGTDTLSRVFIPALAYDNPHLMAHDPGYVKRLGILDRLTRAQLRDGDWMAKAAPGTYYQRPWFNWLDVAPADVVLRCRRWDLGSTTDGDWTIGARMSLLRNRTVVLEDVKRVRLRPDPRDKLIVDTAKDDGRLVHVVLPQDPGQAGVSQVAYFVRQLLGYVVKSVRETGDKETRQQPFSAQVEAGNVAAVRGAWNDATMEILEAFPTPGVHDDDLDACAGAFTYLAEQLPDLEYLMGIEAMSR